MRILRTTLIVLTIIATSLTTVVYGQYTLSDQRNGGISPVHHISEKGRQFIIDEFGDCRDLAALIDAIEKYEMAHFSYDYDYAMPLVQSFDFDTFLKVKKGVCWELAAFAKIVITEISTLNGWRVSNYIIDMRPKNNFAKTHSYNYVIADDIIYTFDLTSAVAHRNPWRRQFVGNSLEDIYNYAERMNEDVYRVH